MKRKPLILATALTAAALAQTSCQWNIGESIRTAAETHVGLDYHRPLDNCVYRVGPRGEKGRYYARLSELRYHVMPDLVRSTNFGGASSDMMGYGLCGAEPTGRVAVAELEVDFIGYHEQNDGEGPSVGVACRSQAPTRIERVLREVEALPAGAVRVTYRPCVGEDALIEGWREPESAPGPLRRAAATACEYSLDPLLSFTSTSLLCVGAAAGIIVSWPIVFVEQQCEPEPNPPPTPQAAASARAHDRAGTMKTN